MLNTISVGASLFFLAAVFPPYNVYIAQSISQKNLKKYIMIVFFSVLGLGLGSAMIYWGSQKIGFPIELIGGSIIIYLAIKMFFKADENSIDIKELEIKENLSGAISCMIMSMLPGAYSLTVAKGLATMDYFLVLTVFLAGPVLGTSLGGLLLYKGTKISRIPLNKVGGVMLFLVGSMTFFEYFMN